MRIIMQTNTNGAELQPITNETAVIRTSDRLGFKSCRRRWNLQSHLHRNLEPKQTVTPLWFGTGLHFALEDYFGSKQFPTAADAFTAFVTASMKSGRQTMPDDWEHLQNMGQSMLNYFECYWLRNRDPLRTYIKDGKPQTEINFQIDIPFDIRAMYPDSPYKNAIYSGTIDRISIDEEDRLWLIDYKTTQVMKATHFANDSQVAAYCWAAQHMYPEKEVMGMIYWQFLKDIPKGPTILKSGKASVNKQQRTSHSLYRKVLIDIYGSMENPEIPPDNMDFLNMLSAKETPDHDAYISREKIYKNAHSLHAESQHILAELVDMLNPNLPMYPNANFMCPRMCSFYNVCTSMDDGSDWEHQLNLETQQRAAMDESWRKYLPKKEEE